MPPVVYVAGIWDVPATFDRMAEALGGASWQTYAVSLKPDDGSASLSHLAEELRKFIDDRLGTKRRFNIVAFSMGGLVARYYVQRLGGLSRVAHVITISTPHHGTNTANLGNLPGFLEMRPGSAFLQDLNRDAKRLSKISFTSIWSHLDLMILPADSARLPFGRDVEIPVVLHNWMLTDSRVINAVLIALAERK
jgi:triacylglycerol lipase